MSQSEQELPESQEDSVVSSEGEETKANPFIPNPKALWCPKCKAHHDYTYSSFTSGSGGNRLTTEIYSCNVCKAIMFNPAQTLPWMYGLTGVGVIVFAIGLLIGLTHGEFDFEKPGPEVIFVLFAIFPLLIGGMMIHYMRKWLAWSFAQRKKSAEELEQEAMNAPSATVRNSADKTEP